MMPEALKQVGITEDMVEVFRLFTILNDDDLERLIPISEAIASHIEDTGDMRYMTLLDYITTNIEQYEDEHYPIPNSGPEDML